MISLSDNQLKAVMTAAAPLPVEKRSAFLERVAAQLKLRSHWTDQDGDRAVQTALRGLIHEPAA